MAAEAAGRRLRVYYERAARIVAPAAPTTDTAAVLAHLRPDCAAGQPPAAALVSTNEVHYLLPLAAISAQHELAEALRAYHRLRHAKAHARLAGLGLVAPPGAPPPDAVHVAVPPPPPDANRTCRPLADLLALLGGEAALY